MSLDPQRTQISGLDPKIKDAILHVYMQMNIYIYVFIYIYVYIYIYTSVFMCIYIGHEYESLIESGPFLGGHFGRSQMAF